MAKLDYYELLEFVRSVAYDDNITYAAKYYGVKADDQFLAGYSAALTVAVAVLRDEASFPKTELH